MYNTVTDANTGVATCISHPNVKWDTMADLKSRNMCEARPLAVTIVPPMNNLVPLHDLVNIYFVCTTFRRTFTRQSKAVIIASYMQQTQI